MPAQDSIHDAVVAALEKEGWTITRDPLTIEYGDLYLFIDSDVGVRLVVVDVATEEVVQWLS